VRVALLGAFGLLLVPSMTALVSRRRWVVFTTFVLSLLLPPALPITFARRRRVLPSSHSPCALIVVLSHTLVIVGGRRWPAHALALMLARFVLVIVVITAAIFGRRRGRRARGVSLMIVRHRAHQSSLHASIVAPIVAGALFLALALFSLLAVEVQLAVVGRNSSTTASTRILSLDDGAIIDA
jgi:hypothetical protein